MNNDTLALHLKTTLMALHTDADRLNDTVLTKHVELLHRQLNTAAVAVLSPEQADAVGAQAGVIQPLDGGTDKPK